MPRRDSSPLSQQPHHPYLQGSKELVLWFLNLGRWPFMEEAGGQEANEGEKKIFFCLLQSFIASPQGGSFLSLSLLTSCQSLATFFLLWRVCWLHLESTGGTQIMESSPHFCFIPAKCPRSVKKSLLAYGVKSSLVHLELGYAGCIFSPFYLQLCIQLCIRLYHFRQQLKRQRFLDVSVPFRLWMGLNSPALLRGNVFIDFLNLSTAEKN